jgi:hypothetical protein
VTTAIATCSICGCELVDRHHLAMTCGSPDCDAQVHRNAEKSRARNADRGKFLAIDRRERLHALGELVRWEKAAAEADARSERAIAKAARKRAREIVDVLGFDPLAYVPDRSVSDAASEDNALGRIIAKRTQVMLRCIPATTSDLAAAANLSASSVRAYLRPYLESGAIVTRLHGRVTWWQEAE